MNVEREIRDTQANEAELNLNSSPASETVIVSNGLHSEEQNLEMYPADEVNGHATIKVGKGHDTQASKSDLNQDGTASERLIASNGLPRKQQNLEANMSTEPFVNEEVHDNVPCSKKANGDIRCVTNNVSVNEEVHSNVPHSKAANVSSSMSVEECDNVPCSKKANGDIRCVTNNVSVNEEVHSNVPHSKAANVSSSMSVEECDLYSKNDVQRNLPQSGEEEPAPTPSWNHSAQKPAPFVGEWCVVETLGEGAFGEVKLLLNTMTGDLVAMKVMTHGGREQTKAAIKKESHIHRLLKDPHIIRYYGERTHNDTVYMFLEYAHGGELFTQIEPDVGMPEFDAHKYFRQLIAGMVYLHSRGVAHRDIKPENLLIDKSGNLKIADFGLATIFRYRAQERVLESGCGTMPYIAPELIDQKYRAEPADIWSCGVVLIAMLTGELPWEAPLPSCEDYINWRDHDDVMLSCPWNKMSTLVFSLIRKILAPVPGMRYSLSQIQDHRWMKETFDQSLGPSHGLRASSPGYKRFLSESRPIMTHDEDEDNAMVSSSQPLPRFHQDNDSHVDTNMSYSQPCNTDLLLIPVSNTENNCESYIRRMTRFFVSVTCEKVLATLQTLLEKEGYRIIRNDAMLTITTIDKRKNPLVFKAISVKMDGQTMMDFRLARGCGLEFKRRFMLIKTALGKLVRDDLLTWSDNTSSIKLPE